ncbi:MAG: hypothetical protein ACLFOY_08865 [Desulfatibacillaceae bacterium]
MGRRDQWKQVQDGMFGDVSKARTNEERENVPDVACGLCMNFSENAYASDGRGFCRKLKVGSDIKVNPPVYVLEGDVGYSTMFNRDAANCQSYERNEQIDTDGYEVADPQYRRVQRQMEKHAKK